MEKWQKILSRTISDIYTLGKFVKIDSKKIGKVARKYPVGINPYYFNLIKKKGGPVWKQCIPDALEIIHNTGREDPLKEKRYTPMSGLVHRYRDRVLLVVSNMCAGYCRFCTRERKIGQKDKI